MPIVEHDLIFSLSTVEVRLGRALLERALLALEDSHPIRTKILSLAVAPGDFSKDDLLALASELAELSHAGVNELGLIPAEQDSAATDKGDAGISVHAFESLALSIQHVMTLVPCFGYTVRTVGP